MLQLSSAYNRYTDRMKPNGKKTNMQTVTMRMLNCYTNVRYNKIQTKELFRGAEEHSVIVKGKVHQEDISTEICVCPINAHSPLLSLYLYLLFQKMEKKYGTKFTNYS